MEHIVEEQLKAYTAISNIATIFSKSEGLIRPHSIITGASGAGKSYLVERITKEHDLHFIELNAAQITVEGVAGNSLSKALAPLKRCQDKPVIIFVDEFDKLLQSDGTEASASRSGVQDEFLKLLEAKTTSVFGEYGKYDEIKCERTLFIFAGAFGSQPIKCTSDLSRLGMKNEFLGRVGIHINVESPSIQSILKCLQNSALLAQYVKYSPKTVNKTKALKDIGDIITNKHRELNLGLRLINSSIHAYFLELH